AMGAGKGERAVASYDEDSVSMAVEAARDAVRGGVAVDTVLFATTSPAYAEKLDAATIQAALDLPESVGSVGLGGSSRMGLAALLLGLDLAAAGRRALVCASDVIVGAPGGARESQGGDGAAAFVTGGDRDAIARVLGRASATIEILDVWRVPEERFTRQWEERFIADTMAPAIADTARRALEAAGVEPSTLATVILDGTNPRSMAGLPNAPPRRRCAGTNGGSSPSSGRAARSARPGTSRRSGCASSAGRSTRCATSASPTPRAASRPTPSITSPTRCSHRWWRRSSTTRAGAASPPS